jgi:hypothetical protein
MVFNQFLFNFRDETLWKIQWGSEKIFSLVHLDRQYQIPVPVLPGTGIWELGHFGALIFAAYGAYIKALANGHIKYLSTVLLPVVVLLINGQRKQKYCTCILYVFIRFITIGSGTVPNNTVPFSCFFLPLQKITDIKGVWGVQVRSVVQYYVHYVDYNKRLDEWVTEDRLDTRKIEPPQVSSHSLRTRA